MKLSEKDGQWLDQLLEQPAVLAGHGFKRSLTARIRREEKLRKSVFFGAGVIWLIILLASFPMQFMTKVFEQSLSVGTLLRELAQSLVELDITATSTETGSVTLFVILLLGAYALISQGSRSF